MSRPPEVSMAMALNWSAEKSQWFGTVMGQTLGGRARPVVSASAEIDAAGERMRHPSH